MSGPKITNKPESKRRGQTRNQRTGEDLSKLSDSELLGRIRGHLKDWEPD